MRPRVSESGRRAAGFTVLELLVVVTLVALLTGVATPAFVRYIRRARTSEVVTALEQIATGAIAYYQTEFVNAATGAPLPRLYPASSLYTPALECCRQTGDRCSGTDWSAPTWQALRFELPGTHFYQYRFFSFGADQSALFFAMGRADLDCDGVRGMWWVTGTTNTDGDVRTTNIVAPQLELE